MAAGFGELQRWSEELNVCIRCGYCYELCPLYKAHPWETDTPRAKMLLAYGLMTGALQPTQTVAEKISECFFCKNCENNCSANVPVTDIIKDAKEALANAGFEVDKTASYVDRDLCGRCYTCVSVCKAEAVEPDEDGQPVVDPVKCECCGVCAASCPSGAISQKKGFGVSREELRELLLACLGKGAPVER